jgi:hypothetical protein
MAHIKEFLSQLVKSDQNNWKTTLLIRWDSIVGHLKTNVSLEKIYEDSLVLSVEDSSWMQELYYLSEVLLTTINNNLDKPRITSLRFRNKGITKKQEGLIVKKTKGPLVKTIHTLTMKEKTALERIADEELQKALKNFLIRCNAKDM